MTHVLDLDAYSTKQSNYFLPEDSPSNVALFTSHLKSKPSFEPPRKKSFKDEMKVSGFIRKNP